MIYNIHVFFKKQKVKRTQLGIKTIRHSGEHSIMLRLFVKPLQCFLAIVYITVSSHVIEYNIIVSKLLGHFFFVLVIATRFLLTIITIKVMMDITPRARLHETRSELKPV